MTDIDIPGFAAWLTSRKYSPTTVSNYTRPLFVAAEMDLNFADVESLDPDDFYRIIYSRNPPSRHASRARFQAVRSYQEYLKRRGA